MSQSVIRQFFTSRQWRGYPYLISPFWDGFLAGGGGLLALLLLLVFSPNEADGLKQQKLYVAALLGVIVFIINDPHFIVSYQLLYRGYRTKLTRFREHRGLYARYILAGLIVPCAMALYFLYALFTQRIEFFSYALTAMLFIVGWHYVKQAYGVFIMLSAMKRIYYKPWQKRLFLINSYLVWVFYGVATVAESTRGNSVSQQLLGVDYAVPDFLTLPAMMTEWVSMLTLACAFLSIIVAIWGQKASFSGLLGYASMYVFLLPAAFHPLWILLYPVFHAMQYLMFVYAYKRGEMRSKRAAGEMAALRHMLQFVLIAFIAGLLFFEGIPSLLEQFLNPKGELALPITLAFVIFINIHHYFIDNVLWRKEHSEIAEYLFKY